ncbi:rod shape-determining protein RodA [Gracilibacillus thailandensis]|uniref:Rod shape-determining protein RodA n=1 Tax=Gracilibacillus thailandensis TaxID=563735 RepID=A0A6N7R4H4_9BACI|nr:rod shape-determining protein RodA [Gracilibacillus thailandensis]MRI68106.1 rod shape-determining protein RodA [Gracilibacillus thailandensis]
MTKKPTLDYLMLLILIGLLMFSLLAVYSGTGQYTDGQSFYFARRQLIWYIVSIAMMIGIAYFDYDLLETWAVYLYILGILLLIYVRYFGIERNGSQRWIDLGFMDLQPSELMKIFLVIYLAAIYKRYGTEKLTFIKSIPLVLKTVVVLVIPFILILKQPDLGSALLIAVATLGLLLMSNISYKMIACVMSVLSSGVILVIYLFTYHEEWISRFFEPHQLGRIYSWINPAEYTMNFGYQLRQAMLGIGAGQLTGSGFNQGYQVQSGRVPEAHTDFVFAVIGEEFGFIGGSILIVLYFLLIYRIIVIALKTDDLFGVYICVGIITLLSFQIFQNIAMTIGLMPVTGIALPFISYGGSALITNMLALGLVQSIYVRSKDYMFASENDMAA